MYKTTLRWRLIQKLVVYNIFLVSQSIAREYDNPTAKLHP